MTGDLFSVGNLREISKMAAIYIETFGCQMNERDTELVSGILESAGHDIIPTPESADWVLFNTCSIREKAEARVISRVRALKGKESRIGILGCMAQRLGEDLRRSGVKVDLIAGTDSYERLPSLLRESGRHPVVDIETSHETDYAGLPHSAPSVFSHLAVMRGCNSFCSYCVVPYVRGRERDKSTVDIEREFRELGNGGVKQVTLIGQKVNAFKDASAGTDFADLLEHLDSLDSEIDRIRFTTSHPSFFGDGFEDRIAGLPKVCEWLHLPVQSGSNRILRSMRRGYTTESFLDLVSRFRQAMPGAGVTSDIIVGFPGETENDFRATIDLVNNARFDSAYMFAYSKREGTRAASLPDDPPLRERLDRLAELIKVQKENTIRVNFDRLGTVQEVMLEKPSRKNQLEWFGRTRANLPVVVSAMDDGKAGDILQVKITEVRTHTLFGKPAEYADSDSSGALSEAARANAGADPQSPGIESNQGEYRDSI